MSNNLKDPRFLVIATLFTIYGLFIICTFLFSTGPMFWKGVCMGVVRRLCCLGGGESVESESDVQHGGGVSASRDAEMRVRSSSSSSSSGNHNNREGTYYQLLSERSKKRLDQLRQCVVERLLWNYTLTLEKEHVVDHQQVERQNITAAVADTVLSDSTSMESNEKTRIDVPDVTTTAITSNDCAVSLSNSTTLYTSTTSLSDDTPDLEKGFFDCSSDIQDNNNNLNNDDGEEENKQEDFSYTHVLLPSPGFGLDGTCMETLLGKDDDEEKCSGKSNSGSGSGSSGNGGEVKKWFMDTFFARRKEEEEEEEEAGAESSTNDNDNSNCSNLNSSSDNGDSTASKGTRDTALVHSDIEEKAASSSSSSSDLQSKPQRDHEHHHHHHHHHCRQVPIFCSICLSEYELSQSICWSNNHQCTHVFHTECMIQWLVTLGRKQSLNKRFTRYPTDRELVGFYELQCPCCRQEFVRSDFIEKECCV